MTVDQENVTVDQDALLEFIGRFVGDHATIQSGCELSMPRNFVSSLSYSTSLIVGDAST